MNKTESILKEHEINITDIKGIKIGQTENVSAGTGCTVILAEKGMAAGLDVRGGGPASRESELMNPLAAAQEIHGIVLAGGSAFGLDAAGGVMQYLEERGIGFDVSVTKVPLVCQADLFDLTVGDMTVRPDKAMGYAACVNAEKGNYRDGCYGAGCGATVGKFAGMEYCMKSGIGSYAVQIGGLQVGAVVAVNALGDIYDWRSGRKIAGLLAEDKCSFRDTVEMMCASADGDSIYAVSAGNVSEKVKADQDLVGTLAAEVMSEAIIRAVTSAESAYGFPAYRELKARENKR